MNAEPSLDTVVQHNVPMYMAVCVGCHNPIAKANMPGMPEGDWLHILTQRVECAS